MESSKTSVHRMDCNRPSRLGDTRKNRWTLTIFNIKGEKIGETNIIQTAWRMIEENGSGYFTKTFA